MRVRAARMLVSAAAVGALLGAGLVISSARGPRGPNELPTRLADTTFWRMFADLSEQSGYFRSDNFVSNEAAFQYVIPDLQRRIEPGGVYIGVGPDQNFTYVTAFQPRIAFIVDIRRQNAMLHLMYKALIELSPDRAEFLSRLFARPRPTGLDSTTSVDALLSAFAIGYRDTLLYRQHFNAISQHLRETHGFPLSVEDLQSIDYVYRAFTQAGPSIMYSFVPGNAGNTSSVGGRFGRFGRSMPTYAALMTEDDGRGMERSYLASEHNYRVLRETQERNLIVPVVGDFAGNKALRRVGSWLRAHGAAVTFVYTSNVEQYLFQQDDDWRRFYRNVAALPLEPRATFIRSVSNRLAGRVQNPDSRSVQMVLPIQELLDALERDKRLTYGDVVEMSR